MEKAHSRRGKRNRQRGAELQREIVKLSKECDLKSFNRDRGGAQHEQGDIEINGQFYGCKRRKTMAQWLYPEKHEMGVFIRADRQEPMVVISARWFLKMLKMMEYYEYVMSLKKEWTEEQQQEDWEDAH